MPLQDIDFFKQALDAAKTGIWEWNIQTNSLYWTERVCKIFDLPADMPITMELFQDLIHPEDRELTRKKIHAAMQPDFNGHYHVTHRIIGYQDKKIRWVEGFGKVYFDNNGTPLLFTGTVHDVTESKLFDLEKEKIEKLFLKSPIPIAVIQGSKQTYILANDPYCEMVGMKGKDLRGLTIDDVFPSRDANAHRVLMDVFNTGQRFTAKEYRVYNDWYRTGQMVEKFFDVIFEQVPGDSPETNSVMIMAVDVTEQVRHRHSKTVNEEELIQAKAAAEEANISKSRFLANMSHEIRTPLGIIMGFTDLAFEHVHSPEAVKHYLLGIQRNGQLLNRIVGEILDLSKIEASKLELEIISFPLKEMFEETISTLQLNALEKNITLSLQLDTNLPHVIESDPTRLRQIIINLIGNAIKFTDTGSVTVKVTWLEPGILEFQVEDTGIGITPDQQAKLFQPFSQADMSMTRRFGGTGLGLILAKELSQALGGDLILTRSSIEAGSLFTATIKPHSAQWTEVQAVTTPNRKTQLKFDLKDTKILVVDDSEDNRYLITQILQTNGAVTDEAENGLVGLAKASQNDYDIILMDLQMPIMDGRQATRTMRNQGIDTPIIALTAHALKEEKQKALKEGFTEYLTKPINREVLLSTIENLRH